ncbi:MAG: hypothetical protein VR68_04685 [Peptococcaceae bacterium BRH_c4a]|nr:MAG: hypothetical protein VR68_04685 [Peptococcaceae bacterium BRH_c4a]
MKAKIVIPLLSVIILSLITAAWAAETGLDIYPRNVHIGLGFNGAEITVSGRAPDDAGIFVKVSSPADSITVMNKKGKVGMFWLNTERVRMTEVPRLYHIISSAPFSQVSADLRQQLGLGGDFPEIYSRAIIDKHREDDWVPVTGEEALEYIEASIGINRKNGLYFTGEKSVKVEDGKFSGKVRLPPGIPQETIDVTMYAIRDGQLLDIKTGSINVSSTGIIQWLNIMAFYDGPSYGLIAVIIALVSGVLITTLFNYAESLLGGSEKPGIGRELNH